MLRLSSHSLFIKTGRYQGINNVNRLCQFCKSDVEDEFHFVLKVRGPFVQTLCIEKDSCMDAI